MLIFDPPICAPSISLSKSVQPCEKWCPHIERSQPNRLSNISIKWLYKHFLAKHHHTHSKLFFPQITHIMLRLAINNWEIHYTPQQQKTTYICQAKVNQWQADLYTYIPWVNMRGGGGKIFWDFRCNQDAFPIQTTILFQNNWDQNTDLKMTAFQNKYRFMLTTARKSHLSPKQTCWLSMTVLNKWNDSLHERQLVSSLTKDGRCVRT